MAELKRYADFAGLKVAPKSDQKSNIIDPVKVKELEQFFELLRKNLMVKKTV
ncbi:hypothetical protein [Mucilaginibacter flavus]|uniref:hypothetical protein n=1 Tax=Mucilaginibacter flavus TaxID=931504 RepID=UPI0025B5A0FA|nr:hypothetical protein [Mucilaginibacter flavus]MDN3583885.1 hypothetical protein [Mucilaginibacter flavus]